MNKYLKFEYWNTCDLGNIYYQGGQHFIFYLDADVGEPIHEEVEEGQENGDGDFIPTYRRQMKRYRIRTGLIPDYLIDAIQRMKLHDHIELTFKSGEVEQIYNVDCEVEWQFEKYAWQGTVTLTFDMDESITVGACCDNLTVETGEPIPDYYWIAPDGDDGTGDGSYTTPWKTLAYACTQVTTPGETIHVKAGTYTETAQSVLAPGVSIEGATAATSIITTAAALSPIIALSAVAEGENGNQSISKITVDGDLTAVSLIYISGRSNVHIYDCIFIDALTYGVTFRGRIDTTNAAPGVYATNNVFRNNTMTNCGSYVGSGRANLEYSGQQGFLIYSNNITQSDRLTGFHGHCIKSVINYGYSKGVKIYDNTLIVPDDEGRGFEFAIETWNQYGIEIYNNIIKGAVDLGGHFSGLKDIYAFGASIHDNTIGFDSLLPEGVTGIYVEGDSEDVYIYRNYIKNCSTGVYLNPVGSASDLTVLGRQYHIYEGVYIHYNIFDNIGENALGDSSKGWGVRLLGADDFNHTLNNLQIHNNIMIGDTDATSTFSGLFIHAFGTLTNVSFRNNIVRNFDYAPTYMANGAIINTIVDYLSIENNIFFGNGNANVPRYGAGITPTHNTTQNNIIADPVFIGGAPYDFHLQAGSPCINAGLNVGLLTDYDGVAVGDPPEIGAYEYQE
jgi:hypothetical protein